MLEIRICAWRTRNGVLNTDLCYFSFVDTSVNVETFCAQFDRNYLPAEALA